MTHITESYLETHFEIASYIDRKANELYGNNITEFSYRQGQGGLYLLAKNWTDEFEEKYRDTIWGEDLEYYDTLADFLTDKTNEL